MPLSPTYPSTPPPAPTNTNRLATKAAAIVCVVAVILIALYMIGSTIEERQQYREEAVKSIEDSYAASQTVVGPILVRPFTVISHTTETDDKGVKRVVEHTRSATSWSFPHEMDVAGVLTTSERHHGLYRVPVYEMNSHIAGTVDVADALLRDGESAKDVVYSAPYFAMAVTDVRGIVGSPRMTVDNVSLPIYQGVPQAAKWNPNLQMPLAVAPASLHGRLRFTVDLKLAGTERLKIAPVADLNHIELTSAWPSPLFSGHFLPHDLNVRDDGFKAVWELSSLASATQNQMIQNSDQVDLLQVELITPIDPYKLSDRASKYGILFLIVTFGGFFLFEMMRRMPIHPVQYLLVGLALAIFFLLLISLSEHMEFASAYLLASAACIGVVTFYLISVLRSVPFGLGFGSMLTLLYASIYGLLISEDNALVLGSLLLFGLLATVMVVTRKVDWYRGSTQSTAPVAG